MVKGPYLVSCVLTDTERGLSKPILQQQCSLKLGAAGIKELLNVSEEHLGLADLALKELSTSLKTPNDGQDVPV